MVKALKPKTVIFSNEGKFKLQTISTITSGLSCSTCSKTKQSLLPLLKEPSNFIMQFLPLNHEKFIRYIG